MKAKFKVGQRVRNKYHWKAAPPVFSGLLRDAPGVVKSVHEHRGSPARYVVSFDEWSGYPARDLAVDEDRIELDRERNPSKVHTSKFDRCMRDVKRRGGAKSAAAVCMAGIGYEGSVRKGHRRENPLPTDREIDSDVTLTALDYALSLMSYLREPREREHYDQTIGKHVIAAFKAWKTRSFNRLAHSALKEAQAVIRSSPQWIASSNQHVFAEKAIQKGLAALSFHRNPVRDPEHKKLLLGLAHHFESDERALRRMRKKNPNDPHKTFPNAYFVHGRDRNGNRVYYTGRAGAGFISPDGNEAFRYDSRQAAQARAMNLNRMTAAHGVHFTVLAPRGANPLPALSSRPIYYIVQASKRGEALFLNRAGKLVKRSVDAARFQTTEKAVAATRAHLAKYPASRSFKFDVKLAY